MISLRPPCFLPQCSSVPMTKAGSTMSAFLLERYAGDEESPLIQ